MIKIATPISHLFENSQFAKEIISNSDCLECRDHSLGRDFDNQELFHCEIQPIHKMHEDDFAFLQKIAKVKPQLRLISFHMGSSCEEPELKNNMYCPQGKEYTREELVFNAGENFRQIKAILGEKVSLAVENNNYYPTGAYNYVTDADFISEVVENSKVLLVLDIPHARITAHNKKIDYSTYLRHLPLTECIQLHIGNYGINQDNIAFDSHQMPKNEEWNEARTLLSQNRSIKYLTVETYNDKDELIGSLKEAGRIINELSGRFV